MLIIVVQLLQLYRKVRLEELATRLPILIEFESRRKKIKRFLESSYKSDRSGLDTDSQSVDRKGI